MGMIVRGMGLRFKRWFMRHRGLAFNRTVDAIEGVRGNRFSVYKYKCAQSDSDCIRKFDAGLASEILLGQRIRSHRKREKSMLA